MLFQDPFYLIFLDESNFITITNNEGIIVDVNKGFLKISGFTKEELIGKKHQILSSGVHDESLFQQLWDTISKGETWIGDIRDRSKDGKDLWFRTSIRPQTDENGKVLCYYASHTLINDIKEAEKKQKELLNQTGLLAHLLNHVSDAVIATDLEFNINYWNKGAEILYQLTAEEVLHRPFKDVILTEFGNDSNEEVSIESLLREGYWRGEVTQKDRLGKVYHISSEVRLIKDSHGIATGVLAVNRNITDRVEAVNALRLSEERLKSFMRHCPAPAWIVDEKGGARAFSPSCVLFSGDIPNPFQQDRPVWEFLPDKKAQAWRKQFEKLIKKGEPLQELMVFRSDNEVESAWLMHQFVLSETSSPRLFGGVAIDISARIREEENLRSKEEHLRNLIERNHDLTLVLNLEGVITFCSPASRFVLGAEPDQIVGTPFNLGMSPEALVEWEKRLKKLNQKAGNYDQFEIKYLHKEGNWIYLDVAATNCHHVRTLSGLVLYLRNISSWKEIEQQLVRKNNQLLEIAWLQSDPIRKPISNIISLTESVADQLPALSKERESLRVVRDEALQLEKLVTEIARKANMLMG